MKNSIRFILTAVAILGSVAACGKSSSDGLDIFDPTYEEYAGTNGTDLTAEVTFWHTMGQNIQTNFLEPTIQCNLSKYQNYSRFTRWL